MHEAFKYQVLLPTQPDQEEAYESRVLFNDRHDCGFFTKPLQAKHFSQLRAIIMGQKWQRYDQSTWTQECVGHIIILCEISSDEFYVILKENGKYN